MMKISWRRPSPKKGNPWKQGGGGASDNSGNNGCKSKSDLYWIGVALASIAFVAFSQRSCGCLHKSGAGSTLFRVSISDALLTGFVTHRTMRNLRPR
jgi:hypothetical protein